MFAALLDGKLSSEQENMEDLLTSSVFGAFRYSNASNGLLDFLKKAVRVYGEIPISGATSGFSVGFYDYNFWPNWKDLKGVNNCEPDLVIHIHNSYGEDILVAIEAKFHSGKSSFPTESGDISDQLAKQWVHVYRIAEKLSCKPWLIYLTTDTAAPTEDIEVSRDELLHKAELTDRVKDLRISWLSWRHLAHLFKHSDIPQLTEISSLARYLSLGFFQGMGDFTQLPSLQYRFHANAKAFFWNFNKQPTSEWKFRQ